MKTEHQEQSEFVAWFEAQFPTIKIFAIPNGGKRHIITATMMKREGVKKGVPDIFVPAWKLWIEFKKEKGGTLSPDQKEWLSYLQGCGYQTFVANGAYDGRQKLAQFLDSL